MKDIKNKIEAILKDGRYVDTKCKKENYELYQYLDSNYDIEGFSTRNEFSYILYNEFESIYCVECGLNFKPFNVRKWKYTDTCSKSCTNKRKTKLIILSDLDYFKRISEKSVFTKRNTFIGGKNLHQISAERAALSRKHKQKEITKNMMISKSKKKKKILKNIEDRKDVCINYFGLIRFCVLFISMKYKTNNFVYISKNIKKLLGYRFEELIEMYIFGINEFIVKEIIKESFIRNCEICGEEYSKYDTGGILICCDSNHVCSGSCRQHKKLKDYGNPDCSNRPEVSQETRKILSKRSKEMWNKRSPERKQEIIDKINYSIKNNIIDGKDGYERRSKKLVQTRFDRGQICIIKELDYNNEEYKKYKNEVLSLTKKQKIKSLENFNKRGKRKFHLDHIFPTSKGFLYNIPANLIADIKNLQMLRCYDNISKSNKILDIPEHIANYIKEGNIENIKEEI